MVQRSNSLDHPPVRARVPVCIRTPCSPAPNPAPCLAPSTAPELSQSPRPKSILHAPLLIQPAQPHSSPPASKQSTPSTLSTRSASTSDPAIRTSAQPHLKTSQTKSSHVSRYLPSAGFQLRSVAPQPHNVKGRTFSESCRDPQVPMDPHKAALTSHRRETLL